MTNSAALRRFPSIQAAEFKNNSALPKQRARLPARPSLPDFPSDYRRASPPEDLAERFAFQKLHGDVGRAVIGLAGFVNGDDVRVMNAPRGSRFILKTQQELGVIQQLAVQDLERQAPGGCRGERRSPWAERRSALHRTVPMAPAPSRRTMRKRRESPAARLASIWIPASAGVTRWRLSGERGEPSRGQESVSSGYVLWHWGQARIGFLGKSK